MSEITCPHCKKAFKVDEAGYADILKQVRDDEFESEIHERLEREQETHKLKQQIAINDAIASVEKERDDAQKKLANQTGDHQVQLRLMEKELERVRDHKAKLSTKMLGEDLEQHCEVAFNQIRAAAFPLAYFEKDTASGKKGDFIYRDYDQAGTEFISIMFEMKNEADVTKTKKKNEHFLKKLDKDRNKEDCEYAILVSVLESDNELYNEGIVDKSHRFPKMYVVRPQFFLAIISVLRTAARNSLEYQTELALMKAQTTDVTNFQDKLRSVKDAFSKNYGIASRHFDTAIEEIDKSIDHLQKVKKSLIGSGRQYRLANDKLQDVTIKKLTRGNTTMAAKFDELRGTESEDEGSEE